MVNTCAFIDRREQESINAILEMAEHKTGGRCQRLVVTGCLAERYRDELRKEIPEIDAMLGTGEVPGIVAGHRGGTVRRPPAHASPETPAALLAAARLPLRRPDTPRMLTTPRTSPT